MKKMICCLLLMLLLLPAALGEMLYDTVEVSFEEGFTLTLPADWVCYEVQPSLCEEGYLYCLGSADTSRLMYIQYRKAEYADLESLQSDLEACSGLVLRSASVNPQGTEFLMYTLDSGDASGCMTLFDEGVLNFLFIPQSDNANMLIAATVMDSYSID